MSFVRLTCVLKRWSLGQSLVPSLLVTARSSPVTVEKAKPTWRLKARQEQLLPESCPVVVGSLWKQSVGGGKPQTKLVVDVSVPLEVEVDDVLSDSHSPLAKG